MRKKYSMSKFIPISLMANHASSRRCLNALFLVLRCLVNMAFKWCQYGINTVSKWRQYTVNMPSNSLTGFRPHLGPRLELNLRYVLTWVWRRIDAAMNLWLFELFIFCPFLWFCRASSHCFYAGPWRLCIWHLYGKVWRAHKPMCNNFIRFT